MKRLITLFTLLACFNIPVMAASNTFLDYQNYNHGYCPDCNCAPCQCAGGECEARSCPAPNPCDPPATTCATECGISLWCIGLGLAGLITAAVLIVGNHGGTTHASP